RSAENSEKNDIVSELGIQGVGFGGQAGYGAPWFNVEFGGDFRRYNWPMQGIPLGRGYYQFTNGFTTQTATADGTGSALASFELGLPAVRQRQAGTLTMYLRQWYADGFAQDSWRIAKNTTVE